MVTVEPVFGPGFAANYQMRAKGLRIIVKEPRLSSDAVPTYPTRGRSLPSSAIAYAGIVRGSDASHIAFRLGEYTFEHTPFAGCVVDQANRRLPGMGAPLMRQRIAGFRWRDRG